VCGGDLAVELLVTWLASEENSFSQPQFLT
jgi:hypothetical protein